VTLGVDSGIGIRRALFPVDPARVPCEELDVLVVGSGIAGLTVATSLPRGLRVAVTTKGSLRDGSTWYAQGGVAASLGADDTPKLHLEDTLAAGSGLCDDGAVRILVDDAGDAIRFLERSGLRLDRDGSDRALTREGGHSRNRIVHAGGDATGSAIVRALLDAARGIGITTYERTFVTDLLRDDHGAIAGAVLLSSGGVRVVRCGTVVLATGGYGQLFSETTSPVTCTGDGAAAALRAGAHLADLEFVQFHPTTLAVDSDPRPLISEAMRGEGAVLRDAAGEPVTEGVHPLGDLAPRDVVSRAVAARMRERGDAHVYLDATRLGGAFLEHRFPTILATCRGLGIDPVTEPIPVSPAAHYTMGGIRTDLDGRTNLPGLFAVGEVAASGVHGANRLASNSLLEGVVYGRRVAATVDTGGPVSGAPTPLESIQPAEGARPVGDPARVNLRRSMVERAGVVRSGEGLAQLLADSAPLLAGPVAGAIAACEIENMLELATAIALLALGREESRGAHFRTDFPTERESWHRHQVLVRGSGGSIEVRRVPVGDESRIEFAQVS
jgi:L-aspartate oxidase